MDSKKGMWAVLIIAVIIVAVLFYGEATGAIALAEKRTILECSTARATSVR